MMQSDTITTEDLNLSEHLALRAKKALGERSQQRFNQKQATFDNYGLARPKNTFSNPRFRC